MVGPPDTPIAALSFRPPVLKSSVGARETVTPCRDDWPFVIRLVVIPASKPSALSLMRLVETMAAPAGSRRNKESTGR
jgi:hypothetical protein